MYICLDQSEPVGVQPLIRFHVLQRLFYHTVTEVGSQYVGELSTRQEPPREQATPTGDIHNILSCNTSPCLKTDAAMFDSRLFMQNQCDSWAVAASQMQCP